MKTIQLTKGCVALIDDEDLELVNQYKWHAAGNYATCWRKKNDGSCTTLYMHRLIMGAVRGQQVDHINHDGRDNRRCNLRLCTQAQNQMNRPSYSKSGFKGVYRTKHNKSHPYKAKITRNKIIYELGYFSTAEEAARAYNEAAKKCDSVEFAVLNAA